MRLFEQDSYSMLTRLIDRFAPITVIDVGANVGDTVRRIVQEFPRATVHAFEPEPETFATLVETTKDMPGVRCHRLAVGERAGSITLNVTNNRWCNSALAPNETGRRFYGDWYEVVRRVEVPLVRLDEWAEQNGIGKVDILKIDVQGLELAVLRGAERLLTQTGTSGVTAVNCEAQLIQEYEGAATFSEIDLFFRSCGYVLHQVHELWSKGREQQSSYLDALWLRKDALERLRSLPDEAFFIGPRKLAMDAFRRCAAAGRRRVALFGAGQHTRTIAPVLDNSPVAVAAIIDDNAAVQGSRIAGREVISQEQAIRAGIDAVVLSSDRFEAKLWESSKRLRDAGIEVIRLYPDAPSPADELQYLAFSA